MKMNLPHSFHYRLAWLPFESVSIVRLLVAMASERSLPELMPRQ